MNTAALDYTGDFLPPPEAEALFVCLRDAVPWQQHELRFGQRVVAVPRLTCWYGDAGAAYTYSGIANEPLPWTPALAHVRDRLEQRVGVRFNSVLLNYYRDGKDSVAWHADDEPELGPDPVIASVSLGASRTFWVRERATKKKYSLSLDPGSLLVMGQGVQRTYEHAVLKEPGSAPRINLTFRRVTRRSSS